MSKFLIVIGSLLLIGILFSITRPRNSNKTLEAKSPPQILPEVLLPAKPVVISDDSVAESQMNSFSDPLESINHIKKRLEFIYENHLPASDYLKLIALCNAHVKRWPKGPESEWAYRIISDCNSALGNIAASKKAFSEALSIGGQRIEEKEKKLSGDANHAVEVRVSAEIQAWRDEASKHLRVRDYARTLAVAEDLLKYGPQGEGHAHAIIGSVKLLQLKNTEAQLEFEAAIKCGLKEEAVYESLANAVNVTEKQIPIWERMIKDLNTPESDMRGSMRIGMCHYFLGQMSKDAASLHYPKAAERFQHIISNYPDSGYTTEANHFLAKVTIKK